VPHTTIFTARLELAPITPAIVEAMMLGKRAEAEALVGATLPDAWPGRALVERAFAARLDHIRANPEIRLWGDRVMILREGPRRVVGSVVFHGAPDAEGAVEIAYGVEQESQGKGFGSEGTLASVEWAAGQPDVRVIRATTPSWHAPSKRILAKCGLAVVGQRFGDIMGDLLEYERRI
jgi:[ribosomal protein S5]-alanine N-acetyltransferase